MGQVLTFDNLLPEPSVHALSRKAAGGFLWKFKETL